MSFTCALLVAASLVSVVQSGGKGARSVYEKYKTRQANRRDYWESTEPRAIPAYMVMSSGQYYSFTNKKVHLRSYGGDYYRAQDKCDDMGDDCWGFQTTFGCKDRLGCSQALILEDPKRARKVRTKGTNVYAKKTQTWDAVPLQCSGLVQDEDVEQVGECEEACTQDVDCEIYQWMDDNTCWRGKSQKCHGNDQVVEGYRARPIYWAFTKTDCENLKSDSTADNDLWQCQYNCQWDMTCEMYQFDKKGKCYRGKGKNCQDMHSIKISDSGKKDYKFKWKSLDKDCDGLSRDKRASTSDECKQNCANDNKCSIWQFMDNERCYRGQATQCSSKKNSDVQDSGYRWYIGNGDSHDDNTDDNESQEEYVVMPKGQTCPDDQTITTEAECEALADANPELKWDGSKNWSDRPYGCVVENDMNAPASQVNFNKKKSGSPENDDQAALCFNAEDTDEDYYHYEAPVEGETCQKPLTTRSQCMQMASDHPELIWDGSRNWDNRPAGCVITMADGEVHWNGFDGKFGVESDSVQVPLCYSDGGCGGATHQDLNGEKDRTVEQTTYEGTTDAEKDQSCCSKCQSNAECEYWVRDTETNRCWLKSNNGRDIEPVANANRRGGVKQIARTGRSFTLASDDAMTLPDARSLCQSRDEYLAVPRDQDETDAIRALLPGGKDVRAWLGIHQGSNMVWSMDDPDLNLEWANWREDEGNDNRGTTSGAAMIWKPKWSGEWYDMKIDGRRHYAVCQTVTTSDSDSGPKKCTSCSCTGWDGSNYSSCRKVTASRPCDGYCVQCESDGETPMPGSHTKHSEECARYESKDVDPSPSQRMRRRLLELNY